MLTRRIDFRSMNEDRLITLILWGVFILGAAGLAGTYYVRSHHRPAQIPPAVESHLKETMTEPHKQILPSSQTPIHKEVVTPMDEKQEEMISNNEEPKGGPSPTALTPPSPKATIQETSKANGSFDRAQQITEGVIIGMRGSKGDITDWYKIRSTGRTMVVEFEADLVGKSQCFTVAVFDANKQRVGEDVRNTKASTAIPVKPQSVYYIKVDLTHAPIQSSTYKVHLNFRNREVSS